MIHAYQERMDHFEKKLSIKDKEIGLLKETITVFSKSSLMICYSRFTLTIRALSSEQNLKNGNGKNGN